MKRLDGTPFFAYLMPESIHTQGKKFNRQPPPMLPRLEVT